MGVVVLIVEYWSWLRERRVSSVSYVEVGVVCYDGSWVCVGFGESGDWRLLLDEVVGMGLGGVRVLWMYICDCLMGSMSSMWSGVLDVLMEIGVMELEFLLFGWVGSDYEIVILNLN